MKKLFILFIILSSINISSQIDENKTCIGIEYDMLLNFNKNPYYNSILQISDDITIFKYSEKEIEDKIDDKSDESEINISISNKTPIYIFTSSLSGITEVVKKKNNYIKIKDETTKINWQIMNEYKTISNYQCIKAIGEFKGRVYTAWFTPEIPTNYGPYKFHGLDGAILEIADSKNEVVFFAKEINYSCDNELLNLTLVDGETITRKEYIQESKNKVNNILNNIATKTPRGYNVKVKDVKFNSIEIED